MKRRRLSALVALLASLLVPPTALHAQDGSERIVEVLHSPLPLYTFDWERMWPRGFTNGDDFGCASLVPFGDWRFTPDKTDESGQEVWHRFGNYGVFHCAAILSTAESRAALESARSDYGFFVQLGTARRGSVDWELWALQSGNIPGSTYTLMAREAAKGGRIESFTLLQQRCPPGSMLETKNLVSWRTRYCGIESREQLLSLARRMLDLPPLGTIQRVGSAD